VKKEIMDIKTILYSVLIAGIIVFSGCNRENQELKQDAKNIAESMCKSIETMTKLKAANPADSIQIQKLQGEAQNVQKEMTVLYDEFKKKYGEKATTPEFNKKFGKYLREAMLDCKYLSKEDRAAFEKELAK